MESSGPEVNLEYIAIKRIWWQICLVANIVVYDTTGASMVIRWFVVIRYVANPIDPPLPDRITSMNESGQSRRVDIVEADLVFLYFVHGDVDNGVEIGSRC